MSARALLVLALTAALVAGCGADPAAERRRAVAEVIEAANDRSAETLRVRAGSLLDLIEAQVQREELAADEAQRLTALAEAVRTSADVIDADLLERRRAEQAAEEARRQLAETQKKLQEERRRAEEAAREAAERDDRKGKGKGGGKDDEDEDD